MQPGAAFCQEQPGTLGGVLTGLMEQNVGELSQRIALYRDALAATRGHVERMGAGQEGKHRLLAATEARMEVDEPPVEEPPVDEPLPARMILHCAELRMRVIDPEFDLPQF